MLVDIRVLGGWLASAVVLNLTFTGSGVRLMTIVASAAVAYTAPRRHMFRMLFLIGVSALMLRTAMFFLVSGGSIDSLTTGLQEGLLFLAILSCIGALLSSSDTYDLLRSIPKALFEAGLIVSIGATFAPHLARVASDVRDARKMRGGGRRGTWINAGVIPLISTSLERSISIAESMESRGFGRSRSGPRDSLFRWTAALGASMCLVGGLLWAMGSWEPWAPGLTAAGAVVSMWGFKRLSDSSTRTRYRTSRLTSGEKGLLAVSAASIVFGLALHLLGGPPAGPLIAASLSAPAWYQLREAR